VSAPREPRPDEAQPESAAAPAVEAPKDQLDEQAPVHRFFATQDLQASAPLPEYLWHYTTGAGLKGILESNTMWATELHYLNDGAEFNLGTWLLTQTLAQVIATNPPDVEALKVAHHYFSRMDFVSGQGMMVCSFTTNPDQLSQWRAYTSPGDGYTIGIRAEHLRDVIPTTAVGLRPCDYEPAHAISIARSIVESCVGRFATHRSQDLLITEFRHNVILVATWFKHESFREECEWRVVLMPPIYLREKSVPTPDLEFRAGRHTLIPYTRFPLQLDKPEAQPIVRVGPGNQQLLAQHAVERLAEWNGFNVKVEASSSSLRHW
jgi:hypothetical protein